MSRVNTKEFRPIGGPVESRHPNRWNDTTRDYSTAEVKRLRGSVLIEHTLARRGAELLWERLMQRPFVPALGAMSGNQAMQMVRAGLKAIYLSGWQVAADSNTAGGAAGRPWRVTWRASPA